MGLVVANNYLLLEAVKDSSSQFNAAGEVPNKFKVAYSDGEANKINGKTVYTLDTLGSVTIAGKDYAVCTLDQVVAHVT